MIVNPAKSTKTKRFFKRIKPFDVINTVVILLICFLTVFPLWYVIIASVSAPSALMLNKVSLLPVEPTWVNYKNLFTTYTSIPRAYLNTVVYVLAGTSLSMVLSVCCAFPLTRKEFRGRNGWAFFVAFTMLFNGGMIPTYIVVQGIGIVDTALAMFLPVALLPFNVIVLRTFFGEVPEGIIEAAKIDGCGYFRMLIRIVIPYSLIGMMTVLLFYLVGHWNSFMPGVLYVLQYKQLLPMQNILREIAAAGSATTGSMLTADLMRGVRYAVIVITVLPILVAYPFMQKYFAKGMMIGGLKG